MVKQHDSATKVSSLHLLRGRRLQHHLGIVLSGRPAMLFRFAGLPAKLPADLRMLGMVVGLYGIIYLSASYFEFESYGGLGRELETRR